MPVIQGSNFQNDLEKVCRKGFDLGLGREVADRKSLFYNVQSTTKLNEEILDLGDIDTVPEFDGTLAYADLEENYKMTITQKVYAYGMQIDWKYIKTSQLGIAKSLPKKLGLAMRRRIAADAVSPFSNAFNTTITTRDALQLCSTAHTSSVGGASQSNYATQAFSAVALEARKLSMRKFTSNKDAVLDIQPNMLVGPVDLEDAFDEVNKSNGKVNTDINNINVHKGKFTVVTDVRLTDTNNWFLIDKELMKEYLQWFDVSPVEFSQTGDFDGMTAKYMTRTFYGLGPTGWEWIFGSEVS